MKGFKFGEHGKTYTVLDKISSGWEGTVYTVYSSDGRVMAGKISSVGDDTVKMCPSWGSKDMDLRRRSNPFKLVNIDWFSYAEESLQEEVLQSLRLLKQQQSFHSKLLREKIPCLIPPLVDRGMLLLQSSGDFIPAIYEVYPLVQGKTVKNLLENIESAHLTQSLINTNRVRSGLAIEDAYSRLADLIKKSLLEGIESLHNVGFTLSDDIDFHQANLMYGRINQGNNQIYLIDHHLSPIDSDGCCKDELIHEIEELCKQIRNWHSHGLLVNAYHDGLIEEIAVWL